MEEQVQGEERWQERRRCKVQKPTSRQVHKPQAGKVKSVPLPSLLASLCRSLMSLNGGRRKFKVVVD